MRPRFFSLTTTSLMRFVILINKDIVIQLYHALCGARKIHCWWNVHMFQPFPHASSSSFEQCPPPPHLSLHHLHRLGSQARPVGLVFIIENFISKNLRQNRPATQDCFSWKQSPSCPGRGEGGAKSLAWESEFWQHENIREYSDILVSKREMFKLIFWNSGKDLTPSPVPGQDNYLESQGTQGQIILKILFAGIGGRNALVHIFFSITLFCLFGTYFPSTMWQEVEKCT